MCLRLADKHLRRCRPSGQKAVVIMCHVRLRGFFAAVALWMILGAQSAFAETLSLPFPQGMVGTIGSNVGQANSIRNFSTLGVAKAYFIQNSDIGAFGGAQGNDLSGTLRMVFNNGNVINISGAINWRITQGSTLHYFGFIPAPGSATHVITYGGNLTYTLNGTSNYGLRKIGSTVSYADGTNVSGNAATSGLAALLNDYLTSVRASGPKITGPSGAAGATVSTGTVNENQTAVTPMTADKPVSWVVFGGTDAGAFAIDATTGGLTFLAASDFELPTDADGNNTYVVTVQATDAGGYTALQTVTVTVADLDDTPPVITGVSVASVTAGQTGVAQFTANEAVVWAIGGTDVGVFAVDASGAISFVTAPDHDAPADANGDNIYSLTVTATDVAGNVSQQGLMVTVTAFVAGDTTPPVISGPAAVGVAEGLVTVASYAADEAVTWGLSGPDGGAFAVDAAGAVSFAIPPDFSAPADADGDNVYGTAVTATDAAGNASSQSLAVTVTAVILPDTTPPVIAGPPGGTASVLEGQTSVAAFTADEAVVWAVSGPDAVALVVDAAGALTFVTPPDHATPDDADGDNVYQITVAATDAAGNSTQLPLTIAVTAVILPDKTPPVIAGPPGGTASVLEGQTSVAAFTADEAVVWAVSGPDAVALAVDAVGALTFVTPPDHATPDDADGDNVYQITVAATDAAGNSTQLPLTIAVTAVILPDTTPPVIAGPPGGTASVSEGQTSVAAFTADEAVVWAVSGPDAVALVVDAAGALTFVTPPDHATPGDADGDNVYQITVTATDAAGNSTQTPLTIAVTTVVVPDTTPPVIAGPSGTAAAQIIPVSEGHVAVATFAAGEAVTWAIGGVDAAAFALDPVTGRLRFVVAPDHGQPTDADSDNVYIVSIIATDPAGNQDSLTLTINVMPPAPGDVTPPVLTGPSGTDAAQAVSIAEGQGEVSVFAADEVVRFAVSGTDAAAFAIDPATGTLTFVTPPDHASPTDADGDNAYHIIITATDAAGNLTEVVLVVTVTPSVRPDTVPPVITGPSGDPGAVTATVSLPEGRHGVTALLADEDVVWSVTGGPDAGMIRVNAITGAISFVTNPDFETPADADGDNVYVVTISARDSAGNISTLTLTITVTDAAESDVTPPRIPGPATRSITVPEGQISVTSLRADEAVTWSVTGGPDQAALTVDPADGTVRFLRSPDFDTPADADRDNTYVIRVTATDADGNTTTITLYVIVLDIDDTVAEIFDSYDEDVVEIVEETEANHLRSSLTSLLGMTRTARDRFIANQRMRDRCRDADDPTIMVAETACSRIATRNDIPFGVHGQVQSGTEGRFATGTFQGQTGSFDGTRRRVIEGDFAFVDNGAGVTTVDITGRVAWDRLISERVMLGYFVGASFAQADISKRLIGQSDKISLSMGTYFVAELRPDLYLDGFLSVAASQNMLALQSADIRLDGRYAAQSLLMGLALSGVIAGDGYELRPEIALGYGVTRMDRIRLDATVADMAEPVTADVEAVDFATLRITPELRIPVYANADAATYIIAPSLVCEWVNGVQDCGAGLRLGLQGTSRNRRTQFDIMVEAERVGGKDRVALRAAVQHRF
jgi:hypothetical protein